MIETTKMPSRSYFRILTQNMKRAVIQHFPQNRWQAFPMMYQSMPEKKVLEYTQIHGAVTRNDIIGLLGVSSSTAVRILKNLVKHNLLKQNGKARSTRYTIIKAGCESHTGDTGKN